MFNALYLLFCLVCFFNDTATTEIYTLSLHDALPISDALRFEVRGFGIDVVVIEPGLIKTNFADTAAGSFGKTEDDGAYAEFNAAVAAATAGANEGSLGRFASGPEAVTRKIEKAITARRPKPRYPVTPSARFFLTQRALLPDRLWDALIGTSLPKPKP